MRPGPAASVLACLLGGCSAGGPGGPGEDPLHVVVALVDTLRADHLGSYGYARDTSPHIDAFARESVLFTNARAQAPCTFPSVNSLLTSRDPTAFEHQLGKMIGIPAAIPSIAEILAAEGYRTLAVSSSVVVRNTRSSNNLFGGFGRGFDVFDERCEERDAACVNARALELIDAAADGPFFLYLHYIDPHDPYRPPARHRRRFATPYRGPRFIADGDPNPLVRLLAQGALPDAFGEREIQHLRDLYDEEIAYLDGRFGELLRALEERGLRERTIVVLLSDHGEDFLERRSVKHCRSVRDTQLRTPLIVRVPGVAGGRRIHAAAGNIDLVPTLLDYLDIDASPHAFEGTSLRPLIERAEDSGRTVFSSWNVWRSAVRGEHKMILHRPSGSARVFDLARDPGEEADRSGELPEVAAALRDALDAHIARVARTSAPGSEPGSNGDGDTTERLRALGYLE